MARIRKQARHNARLDQSPDPRSGYPRTPQHEQLEEQLHHEPAASAPAKDTAPSGAAAENEGEGSRTAARSYDQKATRWAQRSEQVEAAADAAEEAVDSGDAVTLRNAELRGKLGQHG